MERISARPPHMRSTASAPAGLAKKLHQTNAYEYGVLGRGLTRVVAQGASLGSILSIASLAFTASSQIAVLEIRLNQPPKRQVAGCGGLLHSVSLFAFLPSCTLIRSTMANLSLNEGYTSAFPSSWSTHSRTLDSTISRLGNSHTPQFPLSPSNKLQDEVGDAVAQEDILATPAAKNIRRRDFAYPPTGRSEPAVEPAGKDDAGTVTVPTPGMGLAKILKSRPRIIKSRPDEDSYSTVYPVSWTISSIYAAPAKSPSPSLSPTPKPTATLLQYNPMERPQEHERNHSSNSQGDVMPRSPVKRRLQKQFWSLSLPKSQQPYSPRSKSVNLGDGRHSNFQALIAPELQRENRRSKAPAQPPVAISPATPPSTEEPSRFSQTSGYSTLLAPSEQFRTSHADTPARSRKNVVLY
jgi:hypothetical protein